MAHGALWLLLGSAIQKYSYLLTYDKCITKNETGYIVHDMSIYSHSLFYVMSTRQSTLQGGRAKKGLFLRVDNYVMVNGRKACD